MDAAALEILRRASGLSIDREGSLVHDGAPIAHARVRQVLLAGLDQDDEGRAIVRVGGQWAYVACEGTPFVVTWCALDPVAETLRIRLNSGERSTIPARALGLRYEGGHDLFLRIHAGRHEARLGRSAWAVLSAALEIDERGGASVMVGATRVLVRART